MNVAAERFYISEFTSRKGAFVLEKFHADNFLVLSEVFEGGYLE